MKKQHLILIALSFLLIVFVCNSINIHHKLLMSTVSRFRNTDLVLSDYHRTLQLNNLIEEPKPLMTVIQRYHICFDQSFSSGILLNNQDNIIFHYLTDLLIQSLNNSVINKNEDQYQLITKTILKINQENKALLDKLNENNIYEVPIIGPYKLKKAYLITLKNINELLKNAIKNDKEFKEYLNIGPK